MRPRMQPQGPGDKTRERMISQDERFNLSIVSSATCTVNCGMTVRWVPGYTSEANNIYDNIAGPVSTHCIFCIYLS